MRRKFHIIGNRYRGVYNGMLLLVSILVIVYLFPKEGKFRYEFQKGSPWLHDNLIAPYNFPIYKSKSEYENEKDSVRKNAKLYYYFDDEVKLNQVDSFTTSYDSRWDEQLALYDSIYFENNSERKKATGIHFAKGDKQRYYRIALKAIDRIYSKGIIEIPDVFDENYNGKETEDIVVIVMKKNIAEDYNFTDYYTLRSAYEYIISQLDIQKTEDDEENKALNFIKELNLNDFLVPNIQYDEETTRKVKKSEIESISQTRGMVQEGELIILKGDVVNNDKYRILESLRLEYENYLGDSTSNYLIILGQFILILISVIILFLFLYSFRRDILQSGIETTFLMLMFVLTILIASLTIEVPLISIYLVPFVILPILIRTFFDTRTALFVHIVTILLIGFIVPNGFEFVFIQFIAGAVSIFSLKTLHRRGQIFKSAGFTFLSYSSIYLGIAIIQEGDMSKIEWTNFAWFAGNGLLVIVAYPLIYLFERVFGFVSDVTLMELSNSNTPLLRQLAEKAPGTFQHSLQVATLAEDAVFHIGGNALLARVGAMYHDIGKMYNPTFFIENQSTEKNPHDEIEADKSAEIIIDHVAYGEKLAKKHKLPEEIISFIKTHHGVSKVQYFYNTYKKEFPDEEIDEERFTYPGPSPFSKEMAVLMMADSIEAASRSLKIINKETITKLVEDIINKRVSENEFNNADITFRDISIIKEAFVKKILNINHTRIEYPK